jgi:hypothetical protein
MVSFLQLASEKKTLFLLQLKLIFGPPYICRLWAEIEAHKWRDLELNLSKTATKKAIEF